MPFPAQITPERLEAMLSAVAEVGMAAVQEAGARLAQAEDAEAFERASRSLAMLGRNLRQTLALKLRLDRDQITLGEARRLDAAADRREAEATHRTAVGLHRARVRRHFQSILWDEYEPREAEAAMEALDQELFELADEAAFLDTPIKTLIARYEAICAAAAADPDRWLEDEDDEDETASPAPARPAPASRAAPAHPP